MSKIIENFLVPLFLIVSIFYAFHSFGNDVILHKAYHHMTPEKAYLEKANISLYFSGDLQVQEMGNNTFFFPRASMKAGECEAMISRINNHHGDYRVNIAQVNSGAQKGITIYFDFDPNLYLISCENFDSIGLQKGFVFRLYNKELLSKLKQANNQPVLRTLHHNKPRIVIDPGHGGRDVGAIGCDGIQEKQVCLAIGTAVGDVLEQNGCSVFLTRNSDCDMQLDERTSYANHNNADLFISIHANYAANPKAIGIETFCMHQNLFKKKCSQLSEMQDCCIAQVMAQRADMAHKLAQSVHYNVCNNVSAFYDESIDRKVKYSVSQVLLGVQVPAILVEVGFVSNPKQAQLLNDPEYRQCIVDGIYNGIKSSLSF
jgi:N-acetylmuramoyl-L-alanine amidase